MRIKLTLFLTMALFSARIWGLGGCTGPLFVTDIPTPTVVFTDTDTICDATGPQDIPFNGTASSSETYASIIVHVCATPVMGGSPATATSTAIAGTNQPYNVTINDLPIGVYTVVAQSQSTELLSARSQLSTPQTLVIENITPPTLTNASYSYNSNTISVSGSGATSTASTQLGTNNMVTIYYAPAETTSYTALYSSTANSDGTFTFNNIDASPLALGTTYDLVAKQNDDYCTSADFSNIIQVTPLANAPTITQIFPNCDGSLTVTGSSLEPGLAVTIYSDGTPVGSGIANSTGIFTVRTSPLTPGSHAIQAQSANSVLSQSYTVNIAQS